VHWIRERYLPDGFPGDAAIVRKSNLSPTARTVSRPPPMSACGHGMVALPQGHLHPSHALRPLFGGHVLISRSYPPRNLGVRVPGRLPAERRARWRRRNRPAGHQQPDWALHITVSTTGPAPAIEGQMTYDMFNQPLVNTGLAGTIDPPTGLDACRLRKPADRHGSRPDSAC